MSLAAAFGKKSEVQLASVVPALLSTADAAAGSAAAASSSDARASRSHVGQKRGRREMEAAGSSSGGAAGAAPRPATKSAPRKRDWPEREARTVFVGGVPTTTTAKALATLFQTKLSAMRASGELAGPEPAVPVEEADEEAVAKDGSEAADGAADKASDDAVEKPSEMDGSDSDSDDEEVADAAGGKAASGEGEKKGKGKGKARKLTADIESIRFRSIPVAPVAIAPGADFKTMTKAAFIKKSFAEGRDAMNAYIVFTSQAAAKAALALNNALHEGRHLRVDRAGPREDGRKARYDPKRTVFVGQVHFEASEEELRSLFAGRVSGGDPSIEAVRIVRDPATSKGKGIAYILFTERTHVAEALGVNGASFKGRNVRVTRCMDMEKAPPIAHGDAAKKRLASKGAAGRRDSSGGGPGGPQRGRLADGKKDRHSKRPGSASASASGAAGSDARAPRDRSETGGDRPRSAPAASGSGSGSSRAPSAAPPAKRPAHMGATGAETVSAKASMRESADRRKSFKGGKPKFGGSGGGKPGHAGGGRPSGGRPGGKFGGKPGGGGGGKPRAGGKPGGAGKGKPPSKA